MTLGIAPIVTRVGRHDLGAMRDEWDALLARSGATLPFLTWSWVSAWVDTLGAGADLEILIARDPVDGRLVGIAPFVVERRLRAGIPHTVLRFLGSGAASADHLDLVVEEGRPEVAEMLWTALEAERRWDLIDLDGAAAGGKVADLALRRSDDLTRHTALIPYLRLPLSGEWEDVAEHFGRSHRSNIRRYSRKMDREAGAPVSLRLVAEHDDVIDTIDRLGELHQQVRTAQGDRGAFATPQLCEFHRTMAVRLAAAGRLRLHRLDVGDEMAAAICCFRQAGTVSFYTTGYDERWGRYGPGRRVMAAAIRSALEEGATEFDFLRGDEPYKRSWGAEVRHDLRITRPTTRRGRILWVGRSARRLLRLGQ
jgi:CelD/BcsL family acetyltransferase involved in cellulose biosynthesis